MRVCPERALLLFAALAPLWSAPAAEEAGVRVALRWTRVPEAVAYQLEIARDPLFRDVVVRERVALNGYRWSAAPTQTFHWRVRSVDASGRLGDWSEPRTIDRYQPPPVAPEPPPAAPRLLSPDSGSRLVWKEPAPSVSLSWSRVKGATGYQLQLGPQDGEAQLRATSQPEHTFTPSGAGTWVWRVRTLRGEAGSAWTEPALIKVELQAPVVLAPEPQQRLSTRGPLAQLEVRWTPVPGATAYRVQLARDAGFTALASTQRVVDASGCLLTGFPAGGYFLRVTAEALDGKLATSSQVLPVELVQLPPLDAPGLLEPPPDAVASPGAALSFRWTPVAQARAYELLIEPVAGAGASQTVPSSTPLLQLAPAGGGEQVWRVRAVDADGSPGQWSERRRLLVGVPLAQRGELHTQSAALVADGSASTPLTLVLLDARGRPIRGAHPVLSASVGTLTAPVEEDGTYAAVYTAPEDPPSSGEAVIRVQDRSLELTTRLAIRPRHGLLRVGAELGWNASFGVLSSPYLGLAVDGRLPVLGFRLGLGLRAGGYFGTRQLPGLAGPLRSEAWVGRASLLLSFDHRLPWATLYGAAGPSLQAVRVGLDQLVTGGLAPGLQVLVGALRSWGPGMITAELSYSHGEFRSEDVSLRVGGLTAAVGYRVALR